VVGEIPLRFLKLKLWEKEELEQKLKLYGQYKKSTS
jgi:hypothetical protein